MKLWSILLLNGFYHQSKFTGQNEKFSPHRVSSADLKKSIFTHGNYSNMSYTRSNKICCETEILTEHRPSQEMHYYGLNTQEVTSNDVAINLMQAVKVTTAGSNGYDCYTNGREMYLLNQSLATKCQLQSEGQRGNRFICGRGFRNIPLKFEHR